MRILVLGAGAVGGIFGARLVQAGAQVSFAARPARAAALRQRGLRVRLPEGPFERRIDVRTAPELGGGCDLLLLSCKAYDLEAAMETAAAALGPHTIVVPLLNGMRHLETLERRFGPARVAGGTCHLSACVEADGSITQLSPAARIAVGPRRAVSPRGRGTLDALAALFSSTAVECRLSEQIMQEMWEKFAFLATLASATCLMRAAVGDIVATAPGRRLIVDGFEACAACAAAAGFPMREEAKRDFLDTLTRPASSLTSSMLRDLEAGHRLETEHVVGDMMRRIHAMGGASPLLEAAFVHLQARDARLARERNG